MSTHPHLVVERRGPILNVTLSNRARRNSQTPSLWLALAEVAKAVPEDVRVVIIGGAGPAFSAGLDRGMLAPGGMAGEPDILGPAAVGDLAGVADLIGTLQEGFLTWRECPAIVIAAVQGYAVGAGFQLALAADLRVVADDVQFIMGEATLGMVPDLAGTAPLVHLLGYPKALEVCATARPIGAAEAVASGLASLAVPAEELPQAALDLAEAIMAAPGPTIRALKRVMVSAIDTPVREQVRVEREAQAPLLAGLAAQAARAGRRD